MGIKKGTCGARPQDPALSAWHLVPLAEEIAEIFRARDVHRETLAALAVFQAAAALDAATADLARDLAAYLTRARLDPELRFERER